MKPLSISFSFNLFSFDEFELFYYCFKLKHLIDDPNRFVSEQLLKFSSLHTAT